MEKKFIRQVLKRLQCSGARKKEIRRQMESEILAGTEKGEKAEDILKKMGTPEEVAEKLNQSFTREEKKKFRKEQRIYRFSTAAALLLILILGVCRMMPKSIPLEESGIFQTDEVQELAEQTVLLLGEGNYEEIQAYAAEDMKSVLTAEQMDAVKENFGSDWGEFQAFGNLYMAEVQQKGTRMAVVQVNASYEHASITYTVSFDENMQLAGLWMK